MSTISDAVRKRKKEAGEEEVKEVVPVSLEEPEVEVPKDKSVKKVVTLAIIVLLIGGVAFGGVMLYRELQGGKSPGGTRAQVASLPEPETGDELPGEEPREAMPLTEALPEPAETAEGIGPEMPGEPLPLQPSPEDSSHGPAEESPLEGGPTSPQEAVAAVLGEPGDAPETAEAVEPDPFAGIILQGIIRFDPESPEALINGKALKVGESIKGMEVVEIGAESVKLRYGNIEKVIGYR